MRAAAPLVLLPLLLAGCLLPPAGEGGERWRFGGSFTQDYTQEDARAVCDAAREHNPECAMAASFPPQYGFVFPSREACEAARARVLAVPHVAGVTPCAREA